MYAFPVEHVRGSGILTHPQTQMEIDVACSYEED